jgi:beta-galactosidase
MAMGTGSAFTLQASSGRKSQVLLLSPVEGRLVWKARCWGQERLFLSPAGMVFDGDQLRLTARRPEELWFAVHPAPEPDLYCGTAELTRQPDGIFTRYSVDCAAQYNLPELTVHKIKAAAPARQVPIGPQGVAQAPDESDFDSAEQWEVRLPAGALDGPFKTFLQVDYAGDAARAYIGDRLVDDDFYYGRTWTIGLNRFAPEVLERGLVLKFLPLRKDSPIYLPPERWPKFGEKEAVLEIRNIQVIYHYAAAITHH